MSELDNYKIVALMPMKAHSERIPQKNIKPFQNKPLFQWMLDSMLTIKNIRNIIINTDNAKQFQDYKAFQDPRIITRKRKASLCGDFVSMNKISLSLMLNHFDSVCLLKFHPLLGSKSQSSLLVALVVISIGEFGFRTLSNSLMLPGISS